MARRWDGIALLFMLAGCADKSGAMTRDLAAGTDLASAGVTDLAINSPSGDGGGAADLAIAAAPDLGAALDAAVAADLQLPPGPAIVSSTPADHTGAVPVATPLSVTFSAPMDPAHSGAALAPPVSLGAAVWSSGNTVVSYSPPSPLAYATQYVLTVSGQDPGGSPLSGPSTVAFSTQPVPDVTAPTIVLTSPVNAATGVSTTDDISIKFSEPMDTSSVALTLTPSLSRSAVWSEGNSRATFSAIALSLPPIVGGGTLYIGKFRPSTSYTVAVAGADLAGNSLGGTTTFGFQTAADVTPASSRPVVSAHTPPHDPGGASPVLTTTPITIVFSKPMDDASVQAAFTLTNVTDSGSPFAVTCTLTTSDHLSYTCSPALLDGNLYTQKLTTNAHDNTAGQNKLFLGTTGFPPSDITSVSWSFAAHTAVDLTPPTAALTKPNPTQGVATDADLEITFSEPMNPTSVLAALNLTANGGAFPVSGVSWSGSGAVMTIKPSVSGNNWPHAQGPSTADNIGVSIGTGARASANNVALAAPFNASFRTVYEHKITLHLTEPANYGTIRQDAANPASLSTVTVGNLHDTIAVGNFNVPVGWPNFVRYISRGQLNFIIPNNVGIIKITGAILQLQIDYGQLTASDFQTCLGALFADSVYQPPLATGGFSGGTLGDPVSTLSNSNDAGIHQGDVTAKVQADFLRAGAQANRSQFRLRWQNEADSCLGVGHPSDGYNVSDGPSTALLLTYDAALP